MIRPFVKLTSSRICNISSQPAFRRAGVMNLVQMSRSERLRLSILINHPKNPTAPEAAQLNPRDLSNQVLNIGESLDRGDLLPIESAFTS